MLQHVRHYLINTYFGLFGFTAAPVLAAARRFEQSIMAVQKKGPIPAGQRMRRLLWRGMLFQIWIAQMHDDELTPFMNHFCGHLEADKNDMLSLDDMMYVAEKLPGSLQKAARMPNCNTVSTLRRWVHERQLPREAFAMSILATMDQPDSRMKSFADFTYYLAKKSPDGRVGIRA